MVPLLLILLAQQPPTNPGFRLAYVRIVYIEDLGSDSGAKIVREQIIGAFLTRTKLTVVKSRELADAIISGAAATSSPSKSPLAHQAPRL